LLALVEAEQRLKYRGVRQSSGRVLNQGIVQAMANRPFERLLQDAAAANAVELLQLGFDAGHLSRRPLLDDRRVEAAQLRHVKERPRALDRRWSRGRGEPLAQPGAHLRERAGERQ